MNTFLSVTFTFFFSYPLGHSALPCYREASLPQVCEQFTAEDGAGSFDGGLLHVQHKFRGLKPGVPYVFFYLDNGVEMGKSPARFDVDSECPQAECPAPVACPSPVSCRDYPADEDIWNQADPAKQLWRRHWEACALNNYQLWQAYSTCKH